MKASKFRDQTVDELHLEEQRLKEQIWRLRFQFAVGQVDNPMKIRLARRDLARVQTILSEKRRAAGAEPPVSQG
jgi:large subunit ribosomal protein L29